jgi:hypothetical protein
MRSRIGVGFQCLVAVIALAAMWIAVAEKRPNPDKKLASRQVTGHVVGYQVGDYAHVIIRSKLGKEYSFFVDDDICFLASNLEEILAVEYDEIERFFSEGGGYFPANVIQSLATQAGGKRWVRSVDAKSTAAELNKCEKKLRDAFEISAAAPAVAAPAELVCEFENAQSRRISGDNPSDFACIKRRAEAGDESQQFYLGLILVGQVPGPKNLHDGLAVLKEVAIRDNKHSPSAMRTIGELYMQSGSPVRNDELAYQWLYLAAQRPPFKGTGYSLQDEKLNAAIPPERRKQLERAADGLLRN